MTTFAARKNVRSMKYRQVFFQVFFYGIVFLLNLRPELLRLPVVSLNLLFLGIIASMLCYTTWNMAVRVLGAAKTSNYIYVTPLVTLLTSALFLSEPFTAASIVGTACIIGGVYMAER